MTTDTQHPQALIEAVARAGHEAEFPSPYDELDQAERELEEHIALAAITAYEQYDAAHPDPAPEPVGDDLPNMVDIPLAWEIVRATKPEQHHPECSYRAHSMLCDCALADGLVYLSEKFRLAHLTQRPGAGVVVPKDVWSVLAVKKMPDNHWVARLTGDERDWGEGTGPTIESAIAAAVARAGEEE